MRTKLGASRLHICMALPDFRLWLHRLAQPVVEVSELFDRQGFNDWFRSQVMLLNSRSPGSQADLDRLMKLDWVGYVDRTLRNAGIRPDQLDEAVHDLIVRIAVRGKLFDIDTIDRLLPRFITAVRNAAITVGQRERRVRSRHVPDPVDIINPAARPMDMDDVIERFRLYVRNNYGEIAAFVLDHRLEGGDTRDLLNSRPELASSYSVKEVVKAIKRAAVRFAAGDPDLLAKIQMAIEAERRTLGKRFAGSRS
jgi:hypothetical protein